MRFRRFGRIAPDAPRFSKVSKLTRRTKASEVPKAVVTRLSLYLRELQNLVREGQTTISSTRLGRRLGLTDAQVRKDIAYFGQFGYPGVGYRCQELIDEIRKILGTDRIWPTAMVGCGHLGQALLGYRGFKAQGFGIQVGFDIAPSRVGLEYHGIRIYHLDQAPEILRAHAIQLAILAVPAEQAREVAELLVSNGVLGILNFAPVTLNLPPRVSVVGVDLAMELEQLAFAVVQQGGH